MFWLKIDVFQQIVVRVYFLKLGFTPCKAEQPLRAMKLQEKEAQKDYSTEEICLERVRP